MKKYNAFLSILFIVFIAVFAFSNTVLAKYPEKPIILTVSYAPGGSTDVAARTMVPYLEK